MDCCSSIVLEFCIDQIEQRQATRQALNGKWYTKAQFKKYYGKVLGMKYFLQAPCYHTLAELDAGPPSRCMALRYDPRWPADTYTYLPVRLVVLEHASVRAEDFGLWFPNLLLLVPVRHLAKLWPSRLAPESKWPVREESVVVVGRLDGPQMMVYDFRVELYENRDPDFIGQGMETLYQHAREFLCFLEWQTSAADEDAFDVAENKIARFLLVP